jgi:hypothetical protein
VQLGVAEREIDGSEALEEWLTIISLVYAYAAAQLDGGRYDRGENWNGDCGARNGERSRDAVAIHSETEFDPDCTDRIHSDASLPWPKVNWEEPSDALRLVRCRNTTLRKYSIRSVYPYIEGMAHRGWPVTSVGWCAPKPHVGGCAP